MTCLHLSCDILRKAFPAECVPTLRKRVRRCVRNAVQADLGRTESVYHACWPTARDTTMTHTWQYTVECWPAWRTRADSCCSSARGPLALRRRADDDGAGARSLALNGRGGTFMVV